MHILIAYGYHAGTTGDYLERALRREHTVTFAGATDGSRPGLALDADLGALYRRLDPKPDLYLWVDGGRVFSFPRGAERLPIPTAAYLIDVHLGPSLRRAQAAFFDHLFVAQRDHLAEYARAGAPADWLPLACDPAVHRPLPGVAEAFDVGFVGSTAGAYARRNALLGALAARFRLNDYRRPYPPGEMAEVYARSRLVFNCSVRGDLNMRVFEALGCGRPLLTDRIGNGLLDLFADGEHLIAYADEAELLDRAAGYLADPAARARVAAAGHALALERHTYAHRARAIVDHAGARFAGRRAPARDWSDARVRLAYARVYSMLRAAGPTRRLLADAWRARRPDPRLAAEFAKLLLRRLRDRTR